MQQAEWLKRQQTGFMCLPEEEEKAVAGQGIAEKEEVTAARHGGEIQKRENSG